MRGTRGADWSPGRRCWHRAWLRTVRSKGRVGPPSERRRLPGRGPKSSTGLFFLLEREGAPTPTGRLSRDDGSCGHVRAYGRSKRANHAIFPTWDAITVLGGADFAANADFSKIAPPKWDLALFVVQGQGPAKYVNAPFALWPSFVPQRRHAVNSLMLAWAAASDGNLFCPDPFEG